MCLFLVATARKTEHPNHTAEQGGSPGRRALTTKYTESTQGCNLKAAEALLSITSLRWSFLIHASFKGACLKG